jgi:hypothetical protein
MTAAGPTQLWAPERGSFQHISGGLRMGANPADSVCDSYGRTHDVPKTWSWRGLGCFQPKVQSIRPSRYML